MERRLDVDGMPVAARAPDAWDRDTAVVLGHGAGQGMDSAFMSFFHRGLAGAGFLSVTFNFPYMEAGRRIPDPQKRLQASYAAVTSAIRRTFAPRRMVIGGKSMGGRVASYIAGDAGHFAGLLFLGYPLHPAGRIDKPRDAHLYALRQPMLFVSGNRDPLARSDLLAAVVERIGDRAAIHWIDGGDHSLRVRASDGESFPEALGVIEMWLSGLRRP